MKKQAKFQILRSVINGEFYARFLAKNGKEVWRTSETYHRIASVQKAILTLYPSFTATESYKGGLCPYEIEDTTKGK